MDQKPTYTVAVVGLGKIGLPLAAQYTSQGQYVVGCDINPAVVDAVNAGHSPILEEPGLQDKVADATHRGLLRATTDTAGAVRECSVVVVIVPLLVDGDHNIDYRAIDSATAAVGRGMQPGTLVVYETTLPVGTTRGRLRAALEQASGLRVGADFFLAFSPERVQSGRIFRDLLTYPKIVGGIDVASTCRAVAFYRSVLGGAEVWEVRDAETAEFVKLIENTYRDVNIALANQFACFAADRGLAVDEAIAAANSQPLSDIHRPGIGVGGHCIPVYPYFLINAARDGEMSLSLEARRVNDSMERWALARLEEVLGGLVGKRVLILGLAYRENVKETAFSVTPRLIDRLEKSGATAIVNDPLFAPDEISRFGTKPAALETLPECEAVILQAYHDHYRSIDWRRIAGLGCRVVLDGRNALDRQAIEDAGMHYLGIGR
jgi:nucleotide sugar dehydrogenase